MLHDHGVPVRTCQLLGFAEPARAHQDQRERNIGGRLRQDARRVGCDHTVASARFEIEVVVTDRHVRDDAQAGAGRVEQGVVDRVMEQRDHGTRSRNSGVKFVHGQRSVVGETHVSADARKSSSAGSGNATRDDDLLPHSCA